jgi:hypothetical protein
MFLWRWHEGSNDRSADVATAEAILAKFPPPAGAVEIERAVETLQSEEGHVFGHNLRVSYRLPADSRPAQVFAYYDTIVPTGWHLADGRDCLTWTQRPPPPRATGETTPTPDTLVVSAPRSQRFYTDGLHTVWIRLSREESGTVRLDSSNRQGPPNCTAAPDGGPDREADAFG